MITKNSLSVFFLVFLYGTLALADHTLPSGSLARLARDTYSLDSSVRYSSLRYEVKMAVSRFAYDVERFIRCTQNGPITRDHDLIPESCEYDLHQVQRSFYPVDRYLYDTYYDYPHVYRNYVSVRNDMRVLPF